MSDPRNDEIAATVCALDTKPITPAKLALSVA
jgi:hypothetical protein